MSSGPFKYDDSYERRQTALELAVKSFENENANPDGDDITVRAEEFLKFLLKEE